MSVASQPLVLLHGFTGCGEVWNDVKSVLSKSRECITLDLPGHGSGSSDLPAEAFSFGGLCSMLRQRFDEAGFDRFDLWGYSMGGRIALHFAVAYPERIHALILESTSPGIVDEEERTRRLTTDEALADRLIAEGLERFVDQWMDQPLFATQKSLPTERQALARRWRMKRDAAGLAAALRGFSVGRQEPLHRHLPHLPMSVLAMAGELDAKYRAIGEEMVRSIPDAQFRIIPAAGHAPHWERPAETAAAVAEFLGSA